MPSRLITTEAAETYTREFFTQYAFTDMLEGFEILGSKRHIDEYGFAYVDVDFVFFDTVGKSFNYTMTVWLETKPSDGSQYLYGEY